MNEYNKIRSSWKERNIPLPPEHGMERVYQKASLIKRKQRISQIVLSVVVLILVGYFFYISAYNDGQVTWGLFLMIGSLTVRIVIEFFYKLKISHFKLAQNVNAFGKELKNYYRSRLWIHLVVTPSLFILYVIGFIMLLPAFKNTLSSGFFTYVIISSIVILMALGIFIAVQIKKEIQLLQQIQNNY